MEPTAVREARKQVNYSQQLAEKGWYHSFELPDGTLIDGVVALEAQKDRYALFPIPADLTGHRVLDIGAWDGWFAFEGPSYDRAAFLAYAAEVLNAHLNPVPLPAEGRLPVFFEDADPLVRSIFGRELSGMNYGSGGSLFAGKAGQKLFSEGLTLYNGRGKNRLPFFDAEGVAGEGFVYIENGVLKAPFCDKKTAQKFGFTSSGSAAAA